MYDREKILETLGELTTSIEKLDGLDVPKLVDDLSAAAKKQEKPPNTLANEFGELEKLAREIGMRVGGSPRW